MLLTEQSTFLVTGVERTHVWVQVIGGDDDGRRVSIPRRHTEYTEEVATVVDNIEEGDYLEAVLVSESEENPDWRFKEVEIQ